MTPLERAAQALQAALQERFGQDFQAGDCGVARLGGYEIDTVSLARAALTAIREPGHDALGKGIYAAENVIDYTTDSYETYRVDAASDMPMPIWRAMIDAMLAETESGT